MHSTAQATKRPWSIDGFDLASIIVKNPSENGWLKVVDCNGEFPINENLANAHLIVKAVNCHNELVEALKMAVCYLNEEIQGVIDEDIKNQCLLVINKIEHALQQAESEA